MTWIKPHVHLRERENCSTHIHHRFYWGSIAARNVQASSTRGQGDNLPLHAAQLTLSLHQTQLQHLGLNLDVRRVGFRAVGDAALIKRKAIAVTLDHASASSLPM